MSRSRSRTPPPAEGAHLAGTERAQAVQQAMAEIRSRYDHPYYWAPFVLVGKYS